MVKRSAFLRLTLARLFRLPLLGMLVAMAFVVSQSAGALAHSGHSRGFTTDLMPIASAQNNAGLALELHEPSGLQHHGSANAGVCCDVMAGSCNTVGTDLSAALVFPLKVALLVVPHPQVTGHGRIPEIELPPPR